MKNTVIGAGKLGLATATSLARIGHTVICVDRDEYRVEQLSRGWLPFAEPEFNALLTDAVDRRQLQFTSRLREAVAGADTILLAVDTPPVADGSPDLRELWIVTDMLMYHLRTGTRLVIKSAVPRDTNQQVANRINRMTWRNVDVISDPCYLEPEGMLHQS
jgi:UDPglucose 6-dehydrogenase